ncbi:hypothetical protein N7541_002480 [Penicillium brevicompactum]|uniref:F-box domain-containing protein n=1 Tax=Penicillium brevicompactum TaxID=5074 RepID=A0A9W9RK65_PENBR|nr:hypothetical protein N7541_002480 [Penicillium brevicompactum]
MNTIRPKRSLSNLPAELILMIAKSLDPADLACLSSTNRRFQALLHPTPPISPRDPLRIDLLTRLAYDLTDHYVCFVCSRLHKFEGGTVPVPVCRLPRYSKIMASATELSCRQAMDRFSSQAKVAYEFNFIHPQLMIARFLPLPGFGIPVQKFIVKTGPFALEGRGLRWCAPAPETVRDLEARLMVAMESTQAQDRLASLGQNPRLRTTQSKIFPQENMPLIFPVGQYGEMFITESFEPNKQVYDIDIGAANRIASAIRWGFVLSVTYTRTTKEGRPDKVVDA